MSLICNALQEHGSWNLICLFIMGCGFWNVPYLTFVFDTGKKWYKFASYPAPEAFYLENKCHLRSLIIVAMC